MYYTPKTKIVSIGAEIDYGAIAADRLSRFLLR